MNPSLEKLCEEIFAPDASIRGKYNKDGKAFDYWSATRWTFIWTDNGLLCNG